MLRKITLSVCTNKFVTRDRHKRVRYGGSKPGLKYSENVNIVIIDERGNIIDFISETVNIAKPKIKSVKVRITIYRVTETRDSYKPKGSALVVLVAPLLVSPMALPVLVAAV